MQRNVFMYKRNGTFAEVCKIQIKFQGKCREVLTKLEMKFLKCREVPKI